MSAKSLLTANISTALSWKTKQISVINAKVVQQNNLRCYVV